MPSFGYTVLTAGCCDVGGVQTAGLFQAYFVFCGAAGGEVTETGGSFLGGTPFLVWTCFSFCYSPWIFLDRASVFTLQTMSVYLRGQGLQNTSVSLRRSGA